MSTILDTGSVTTSSSAATPLSPEQVRGLSPRNIYGRDVQAVAKDLNVDIEKGLTGEMEY